MTRFVRSLPLAAVLGALLAAVPAAPAAAAPSEVWRRELPGGPVYESSPVLADLDASGTLDLAFGAHDQRVHALKATDGSNVPGWPQGTSHRINSSPAAADVDGDGRPELFVGTGTDGNATPGEEGGALYAYGAAGQLRFRRTLTDKVFTRGAAVHSSPAIGDLNRDGRLDVAVGSLGLASAWSLDRNGGTIHNYPGPDGDDVYWDDTIFASPAIADVNGDGVNDAIFGGDSSPGPPVDHQGGLVRAFSGNDGRVLWEIRPNDIVRSSPSVGDVDGDGKLEVVFGGGEFWGGSDATNVWVIDATTGVKQWQRRLNGVVNASPTLADLDGDGRLDIAVGTFNSQAKFGQGAGGSVYALRGTDGRDMTGFPKASGGGAVLGQIVTADLDGDGGQDLLVPTGAFIAAFDGGSGASLFRLAEGDGVSFQNSPAVADVDGDGRLDVVAAGIRPSNGSGMAFRWTLDASARLGERGWHQFRKDARRTGSFTSPVPNAGTIPFSRISGVDRYATAAALAERHAGTVFVATGTAFADALAGGPAAAELGAPVLLVQRDAVPVATATELRALAPDRIVVLGGPAAVSERTLDQLAQYADEVDRIAGDDRFDTAARISADTFLPLVPVAYVATGRSFADALAGAAAGARQGGPVLLVEPGSLPSSTATELRRLLPRSIVILGGTGAVSAAVEAELRTYSASVTRVAGADRYDTAVRLARSAFPGGADEVYVATGRTFPDALAGGPVVGAAGAPFLLVPGRCVPLTVRTELDRLGAGRLVLLGGEGAVSSSVGALNPC